MLKEIKAIVGEFASRYNGEPFDLRSRFDIICCIILSNSIYPPVCMSMCKLSRCVLYFNYKSPLCTKVNK